jgi:hypothetical protein
MGYKISYGWSDTLSLPHCLYAVFNVCLIFYSATHENSCQVPIKCSSINNHQMSKGFVLYSEMITDQYRFKKWQIRVRTTHMEQRTLWPTTD